MIYNNNSNKERDEMQKANAMDALNNIANSHSIKDLLLEKKSNDLSSENASNVTSKRDNTDDNSDGSYKIENFL
ncbi:hypothetical protein [Clostridium psychrophilum]|uniref:hypothetical protein n=1 Tax=Clostridium psychrophilum TaxID=132926 RepID=UPI001C0AC0FD|nr:hypothetical protein [Clostridium psychrophilum]MBU3181059.1 hypothetical protein [Clostridium psychrophilum]